MAGHMGASCVGSAEGSVQVLLGGATGRLELHSACAAIRSLYMLGTYTSEHVYSSLERRYLTA